MAVERGACVPARGGRKKMNFKISIFQMILLYFCGPASRLECENDILPVHFVSFDVKFGLVYSNVCLSL